MTKQKKKSLGMKSLIVPKTNKRKICQFETPLLASNQVNLAPKRKLADLTSFLKKEEAISPPTIEKRYSLQMYLKQKSTSIQVLALQCPNFLAAVNTIQKNSQIQKHRIYAAIQSYFHGTKHQLWSDKYSPKSLKDCIHQSIGQKILKWILVYKNYRNCCLQESNSLFDYFGQANSNSDYKFLKQNTWKLRGLILKGRSGVGKSTVIVVATKQMKLELFNCGNQCNQIRYLKQKNEATQSESVKTKISKNQAEMQKSNKTLTSFALKNEKQENEHQFKKIQYMHNVNSFYPKEEEIGFYKQLNKTIESSKIPFIMTLTGEEIPETLKIYDVIEFEEAKSEDVARLLLLIYQIEKSFSKHLNLDVIVERQKFKTQLDLQFQKFELQIQPSLQTMTKVVDISNKKLDFLFTFVENCYRQKKPIQVKEIQTMIKDFMRRADQDKLMNDYFYAQAPHLGQQSDSKRQTVQSSHETIQFKHELILSKQIQIVEANSSSDNLNEFSFSSSNSKNSKSTKSEAKDFLLESIIEKTEEKEQKTAFKQIIKQLDIKVIQDYKAEVRKDECFIFSKLYDEETFETEQNLMCNIQIKLHQKIRKNILRNIKKQYYSHNQLVTSLKPKQLNFIGFLIDSRSRASRKLKAKDQLNLKKLLRGNQINYLKSFTLFLKPNSQELKISNLKTEV